MQNTHLPKKNTPIWVDSTIAEDRISFIIFQVKNRKVPKTGEQSRSQMTPTKVGLGSHSPAFPYGVVCMELGDLHNNGIGKLAGCSARNPAEKNQLGLLVSGLDAAIYPCIKDDNKNTGIAKQLVQILESWPDPLQLASGNEFEVAALKNMLPLQYQ